MTTPNIPTEPEVRAWFDSHNRWGVVFTVAPLRWHNAAGAPVHPPATF